MMKCDAVQYNLNLARGNSDASPSCIATLAGFFTGDNTMKHIPLTQGKFAIVDDEDYEWLNQWKWCAMKSGSGHRAGRSIKINGKWKIHSMSRIIVNAPDHLLVDHKNHIIHDSRRSNLRLCTSSQNCANQLRKTGGASKYKGVGYDTSRKRNKRWVARLNYCGKYINLGRFLMEIEAAKSYDAKAKEVYGEFAYLNFKEKP